MSKEIIMGDEKNWGDPTQAQVRQQFTTGESVMAIVWLSIAAIVLLILEVVFLPTRVTLGSTSIPVPWPIVLAYLGNLIISNTAKLWTPKQSIAAIPVIVWGAGIVFFVLWAGIYGDQAFGPWVRTIAMIAAGAIGGAWPILRFEDEYREALRSAQN